MQRSGHTAQRSFSDSGLPAKRSVLIALSGGIDSTAAALMLLEQGYELVGCTFTTRYTSPASVEAARSVAARLGIEHHIIDYSQRFEDTIIQYFIGEYQAGRTPNPCVLCNREIKFGALVEEADRLGCALIATGHYARISSLPAEGGLSAQRSVSDSGLPASAVGKSVACAKDLSKDQSYFLWQIDPGVLDRVLFPLGDYTKLQVREYLASKGFELLSKQGESQDICFIKDDYRAFLRERLGEDYKEYMSFTIGQRKGLGVALGYPAFVTGIGSRGVECRGVGVEHPLVPGVFLGHHNDLYTDTVTLRDVIFRGDPSAPVMAKIRYRSPAVAAVLQRSGLSAEGGLSAQRSASDSGRLSFTQPIWAATPGQSCVFYQNDLVVGGGIIC